MDPLQIGILVNTHRPAGEALSAQPDAPVVPVVEHRAAGATMRARLAGGLHRVGNGLYRLADTVAPTYADGPAR